MARKKTIGKFDVGARVLVRTGVASPEFSDVPLEGWAGTIQEVAGKKSPVTYVIEWDENTLARMPPEYIRRCEEGGLYYRMVCLSENDLDPAV
jgi:hypothetical protein